MRPVIAAILPILALSPATGASAQGAPGCGAGEASRARIEALLCGQDGAPDRYRAEGPSCVEASLSHRFEDTAAQIELVAECGHDELAGQLREASRAAARAFTRLAGCVGRQVDVERIRALSEEAARTRPGKADCDAANRRMVEEALPDFEAQARFWLSPGAVDRFVARASDGGLSSP